MDEKFLFGVVLGLLGGAVIATTNSMKARQMVKEGQSQVKEKIEGLGKKQKKSTEA